MREALKPPQPAFQARLREVEREYGPGNDADGRGIRLRLAQTRSHLCEDD